MAHVSESSESSSSRTTYFRSEVSQDGFLDDQEDDTFQPLSWRNDELSDWTILASTPSGESRTYHIHKAIVGAGCRRCHYFRALFAHQDVQEHHNGSTSQMELHDSLELDALEVLLDFLYSGNFVVPPSVDRATAEVSVHMVVRLRHLAFYFQCKAFLGAVNHYIEEDLTADTAPWYLCEATRYRDERLVKSSLAICASFLAEIPLPILLTIPIDIFRFVVQSSTLDCESKRLSNIVCYYLKHQQEKVGGGMEEQGT